MELCIALGATEQNGGTYYHIHPFPSPIKAGSPSRTTASALQRFSGLHDRIEKMARRQLGEGFLSLEFKPTLELYSLKVKVGTSHEEGTPLGNLLGWIALFDTETEE